jgi:hypothetical protein
VLTFPRLESANNPDDESILRQREFPADRSAACTINCWSVDTRVNHKSPSARPQASLGVTRLHGGASDRPSGERRCDTIKPMSVRNAMLPPNDTVRHAGRGRPARTVHMRFRRPIQHKIRSLRTQETAHRLNGARRSPELPQTPRWNHDCLDAEACDLTLERAVLEEDDNRFDPRTVEMTEKEEQHVFRSPNALSPRHRYQQLHHGTTTSRERRQWLNLNAITGQSNCSS